MGRKQVLLLVAAVVGACGGGVATHNASDGGPSIDAGAGCSALAMCCTQLSGNLASLCQDIVGAGNAADCATELSQLQSEGHCGNVVQSDASTGSSSGSGSSSGAGSSSSSGSGSSSGPPPPPPSCANMTCTPPLVCNVLPGSNTASCVPKCQSDADCPAFATCQAGLCSVQCSSCPAGQQCGPVVMPRPTQCTSNADCGIGSFCQMGGSMCQPYEACMPCQSGCTTCTTNSQCNAGLVCVNQTCTTCTSNSQCGPSAVCGATHTGMQCTCSMDGDCAPDEVCASGICQWAGPNADGGCPQPFGCQNGLACVNNACGPCSTFAQCNTEPFGDPQPPPGFACINGTCTNCASNSQCGGGMACVQGTCGTCSTNSQCGASGTCTDGFCTCKSDAQCDTGERCGSGVCVPL